MTNKIQHHKNSHHVILSCLECHLLKLDNLWDKHILYKLVLCLVSSLCFIMTANEMRWYPHFWIQGSCCNIPVMEVIMSPKISMLVLRNEHSIKLNIIINELILEPIHTAASLFTFFLLWWGCLEIISSDWNPECFLGSTLHWNLSCCALHSHPVLWHHQCSPHYHLGKIAPLHGRLRIWV